MRSGITGKRYLSFTVVGLLTACVGRADIELTDCWPDCAPLGGSGDVLEGIWLSGAEIASLPASGAAWDEVLRYANMTTTPDLSGVNSDGDVITLAKALVWARTGQEQYRVEARSLCIAAIDTELAGTPQTLGSGLVGYVVAAELVGLEAVEDQQFRAWLRRTLAESLTDGGGYTLRSAHAQRPQVWGTMAGAGRMAVALYLEDAAELQGAIDVFRGFLGDRSAWADFSYDPDAASWSPFAADNLQPLNPIGATVQGINVDGALIDAMRMGGPFAEPPVLVNAPWETLGGLLLQAEILHRKGYPAYEWENRAVERAYDYLWYLHQQHGGWFDAATGAGDDAWQLWIVNARYGSSFPTAPSAGIGKPMGFTDWTHRAAR
ncbi:MAG: hypothetical protein JRI55_18295 [Deltaproteobacteria bacterium]|jgi:hypothetical protein|nr:hypothetical protein [Deltaproteobacteria bacterium]